MSIIQEAIISELQERIEQTKKYTADLHSAKTNAKKEYLKEKRKKNNIEISRLLIALERVKKEADTNE